MDQTRVAKKIFERKQTVDEKKSAEAIRSCDAS
jgi:hypothetical protein